MVNPNSKGRTVSSIWNLIRDLKALTPQGHIALLIDADLDFAQPIAPATKKEQDQ